MVTCVGDIERHERKAEAAEIYQQDVAPQLKILAQMPGDGAEHRTEGKSVVRVFVRFADGPETERCQ